jgi:hypothetical protein
MPANEEALRLAVEIQDKFSPVLRDLQRQMTALNKLGLQQSKDSKFFNEQNVKSFQSLQQASFELSQKLKGTLQPALAAIGITQPVSHHFARRYTPSVRIWLASVLCSNTPAISMPPTLPLWVSVTTNVFPPLSAV